MPEKLSVPIEGIIERLFRFIEMIVVATLIGVVLRVVSPTAADWVAGSLAAAAAIYLALPVVRWTNSFGRSAKRSTLEGKLVAAMFTLLIVAGALRGTEGLRILLSQTFQINEPAARIEYQLWNARSRLKQCRGGTAGHGNPPASDIPGCERLWSMEIERLSAEKQALRP